MSHSICVVFEVVVIDLVMTLIGMRPRIDMQIRRASIVTLVTMIL